MKKRDEKKLLREMSDPALSEQIRYDEMNGDYITPFTNEFDRRQGRQVPSAWPDVQLACAILLLAAVICTYWSI